jgi:cyclopropane fatty-acyl-phospholipid synthase-like methyltransferase
MPPSARPDESNGYEAIASELMRGRDRSQIGVATVRAWSKGLQAGASILDLGCGHGVPISAALMEDGFQLHAVDASASMVARFRQRFPNTPVACEAAESSSFFGRRFDGIVAVGLVFLLPVRAQRQLIERVAPALRPGGRFLFSAPTQRASWRDNLTRRRSISLGAAEYTALLRSAGLDLVEGYIDEGENHYYSAVLQ